MPDANDVSVSLSSRQAQLVDRLIATGSFATPQDVVAAALDAFVDHESDIEQWLSNDVLPIYEDLTAHPERSLPAQEVFARLDQRHARRVASERGA